MRNSFVAALLVGGVALTACGAGRQPGGPAQVSSSSSSTASPTGKPVVVPAPAKPSAAAPASAHALVDRLLAAKLPITKVVDLTAATDGNDLLGRPNGYTSKTTFSDSRIDPASVVDDTPGAVGLGGAVEFFPNAAGASSREDYIQSALAANPALGTEYDYVVGTALLRLSPKLTPAEASAYSRAAND